jgi:ABC-type Na+ efflux pump permease subunit
MLPQFGKILIIAGVVIAIIGVLLMFADRIPFLGRLPGDILFKRGRFTLYLPIVTMLVISAILTIIFSFFGRGK